MNLETIALILGVLTLAFIAAIFFLIQKNREQSQLLSDLAFSKSSQSVKYGKTTEQWIPFSQKFPFNKNTFRFLGNPIDGIAFEENKIVFVEIKTANSQLNENQKKIKKLVQEQKVEWFELRANEKN